MVLGVLRNTDRGSLYTSLKITYNFRTTDTSHETLFNVAWSLQANRPESYNMNHSIQNYSQTIVNDTVSHEI